ncbi:MAG: hypothetical protein M3R47_09110, partial [Chloroflexota bacterium]|nr:hypothetical protein [Chloroflexota bacterium]
MFTSNNKNPDKPGPSWKGDAAHFIILLTFIVLLTSCVPQAPISVAGVASAATGQPQSTAMVTFTSIRGVRNTQLSPKDQMVMVFVPAGQFEMGGYV